MDMMDKRQNALTNSNDLKLVTEIKILARIENNEIYTAENNFYPPLSGWKVTFNVAPSLSEL